MIFRNKKLNAFMTGSLVALVAFGYPSRLLAQSSSMDDPIQGVTSTYQEAPATSSDIEDAANAINAGLNPFDAISPKPLPEREYTAFLVDIWDALFDSEYQLGSSYINTGEWINTPTGALNGVNESGETVNIDVTLSLEILPDQWDNFDQNTLDLYSSVSARMGIAWTTLENSDGDAVNVYLAWVQWSVSDETQSLIFPLNIASQEELDTYTEIIPLMDGFFDNPLYYNIDDYDPSTLGLLSSFRSSVRNATIGVVGAVAAGVGAIAGAVTTAALASGATLATIAAAAAAPVVVAVILITVAVAVGYYIINSALDDLDSDLTAQGYTTTGASAADLLDLARISDLANGV